MPRVSGLESAVASAGPGNRGMTTFRSRVLEGSGAMMLLRCLLGP